MPHAPAARIRSTTWLAALGLLLTTTACGTSSASNGAGPGSQAPLTVIGSDASPPHVFTPRSHPPRVHELPPSPELARLPPLVERTRSCFDPPAPAEGGWSSPPATRGRGGKKKTASRPSRPPGFVPYGKGAGGSAPKAEPKRRSSGSKSSSSNAADLSRPSFGDGGGAASGGVVGGTLGGPAAEPTPVAPVQTTPSTPPRDDDRRMAQSEDEARALEPVIATDGEADADAGYHDWGAAIYLSNDDTMSLSSAQRVIYAIDQFLLGGGRLLLFVDPNANADTSGNDPNNPSAAMFADKSSNLQKLLSHWGVDYKADEVVMDRALGLQVQVSQTEPPVMHPLILGLRAAQMNDQDLVSAKLDLINIDTAGHFKLKEGATATLEPLLQSSSEAGTISTERIRYLPDPRELLKDFTPSGENYIIAARLSGKFTSAFPDRASQPGHIAEAAEPVQAILIADTDILSNRLWVQVQNFFGQQLISPFADNGDLIVNSADNLSGSSALISIRGRNSSTRPFTVVEDMRRAADERFRTTEQQLQEQLSETERKLNELQANKSSENAMIMSPEQQAEVQRFQNEKVRIRKELRDVRRSLDQDIRSLGSRTKFINIALVPILVIIAALLFWHLRRSRRRAVMGGA